MRCTCCETMSIGVVAISCMHLTRFDQHTHSVRPKTLSGFDRTHSLPNTQQSMTMLHTTTQVPTHTWQRVL